MLSAIVVVFAAGSADRLFVIFNYSYEGAIDFFRVAFLVVPVAVYAVTRRVCTELRRSERNPLRGWSGSVVTRGADGGFRVIERPADETDAPDRES